MAKGGFVHKLQWANDQHMSEATVKNKMEEPHSNDIETNGGSILDESDTLYGSMGELAEKERASQEEALGDNQEKDTVGRANNHLAMPQLRLGKAINPPNRFGEWVS